ncbi:hypothetical protein NDU88_006013 [Pleurodeles waltl]|uniref:Uncharacterized protein n=1 Tax=Pleurodeles waltl TaxID=8319 RepID=A0AAV7NRV1_PLEWA|nr:hypothetical protein NDU88_006013 [Pleurodeles waltl]
MRENKSLRKTEAESSRTRVGASLPERTAVTASTQHSSSVSLVLLVRRPAIWQSDGQGQEPVFERPEPVQGFEAAATAAHSAGAGEPELGGVGSVGGWQFPETKESKER